MVASFFPGYTVPRYKSTGWLHHLWNRSAHFLLSARPPARRCLQDTWEWGRVETAPDAPQPCPRDRASLLPIGPSRLLLYGGADAMNRRLDDIWIMDLDL